MIDKLYQLLPQYLPLLVTLVIISLLVWFANWLLLRRTSLNTERRLPRQLLFMSVLVIAVIGVILALPIDASTRSELLGLLGLVLTGMIAFSSTTFVANIMAGLMLRSVKSFFPGDFIRVAEHFGRVTERGLFHTEIQSEGRDLITLPNLFLAQNPVTVVRSTGTIVSCDLSLGYDVPHYKVKPLLVKAAEESRLANPFVHIQELGDFSVSYRVCGFYEEVKQLLSKRSELRRHILDQLHSAGIEIVSPTFMNQRRVADDERFMAPPKPAQLVDDGVPVNPERHIFDKAERAEKIQLLKNERTELTEQLKELRASLDKLEDDEKALQKELIASSEQRIEQLSRIIEMAEQREDTKK